MPDCQLRPATGRCQPLGCPARRLRARHTAQYLLPPAHLLPLEQRLEPVHQPQRAMGRNQRAGRAAGAEQAVRAMTKGDRVQVAFFISDLKCSPLWERACLR